MLNGEDFDLWADGYDRDVGVSDEENSYPFAGYKEVLGRIFEAVLVTPHAKVLDLGFGTGTLTVKLYERGCEIFGQDFSERMIAIAQQKMPDAHLYRGDLSAGLCAPLAKQRYDCIVSTYALHHLSDAQKISLLRTLRERLNPGGCMLIGDVAFPTRKALEDCREEAGGKWDDEEIYFVVDELMTAFPDMRFSPASFCAGILTLPR